MTDEELIARLRLYGSKFHHEFGHNEAADRIEALEAKLAKAVGLLGKSLVKEKRDLSSTLYEEISDFIEEIAEIKGESHD